MSPILGIWASQNYSRYNITGSYESIATGTGTGSNTTITFSSIPQTFTHLQIRGSFLSSSSTVLTPYINGVNTGNQYFIHGIRGNGSAADAYGVSYNNLQIGTAFNATPTIPAVFVWDILDYTNTNKNKVSRWLGGADLNGSGAIEYASTLYLSTAAVTSITIPIASGNFPTGTTIALYGIRGN